MVNGRVFSGDDYRIHRNRHCPELSEEERLIELSETRALKRGYDYCPMCTDES